MMSNADLVEWNDSLTTGIDEVDRQHRFLVSTLHEAKTKLATDPDGKLLGQIILDLLGYALYHFETEESLMKEYDYLSKRKEDAGQHVKEHRDFSKQVVTWQSDLRAGRIVTGEQLLSFLERWLVNHIQDHDQRLCAFILSQKPQV